MSSGGVSGPTQLRCSHCDGTERKVMVCGGCCHDCYCSAECQASAWANHKSKCTHYMAVKAAYKKVFDNYEDFALYAVDWLTELEFAERIAARERRTLESIRAAQQQPLPTLPRVVHLTAALISYKSGQWLALGLSFTCHGETSKVEGVRWLCADPEGGEHLEARSGSSSSSAPSSSSSKSAPSDRHPSNVRAAAAAAAATAAAAAAAAPAGGQQRAQATPRALARSRDLIAHMVANLRAAGFITNSLLLGQGLMPLAQEAVPGVSHVMLDMQQHGGGGRKAADGGGGGLSGGGAAAAAHGGAQASAYGNPGHTHPGGAPPGHGHGSSTSYGGAGGTYGTGHLAAGSNSGSDGAGRMPLVSLTMYGAPAYSNVALGGSGGRGGGSVLQLDSAPRAVGPAQPQGAPLVQASGWGNTGSIPTGGGNSGGGAGAGHAPVSLAAAPLWQSPPLDLLFDGGRQGQVQGQGRAGGLGAAVGLDLMDIDFAPSMMGAGATAGRAVRQPEIGPASGDYQQYAAETSQRSKRR